MEMIINTVRMIDHDQLKEYAFGDLKSLNTKLAIGFVNPKDFKKLNLTPSLNLRIKSKFGQIIVKVEQKEDIPVGMIVMPVSIWSNQITGVENNELIFKNIKADVEATQDHVLEFEQLINSIKENQEN